MKQDLWSGGIVKAYYEKCKLSKLMLVSKPALTMSSHAKEIYFFADEVVRSGTCCSGAGWQYLHHSVFGVFHSLMCVMHAYLCAHINL